jgi:Sel1 repeat
MVVTANKQTEWRIKQMAWTIGLKRLCLRSARPRGAQFRRRSIVAVQLSMWVVCGLVVSSCASESKAPAPIVRAPTETPFNLGAAAYKDKNYSEAAKQWTQSVASGNVEAMNNLGYLLYYGHGVDVDTPRAIALWRVASYAGNSESQWHLGVAYETGVGVQQSLPKAYAWYRCAVENATNKSRKATNGSEAAILEHAKGSLDKLQRRLGASDLEAGEVLAAEYIARYGKPAP